MKSKTTIIIVDDNELDLLISSRIIGKVTPDTPIKTFNCGNEVIKCLEEDLLTCQNDNVIFLIDVYMKSYNGFQLIEELKELLFNQDFSTSFYLLSASIDPNDLEKIKEKPIITSFISKPLSTDDVNNFKF